MTHDRRSMVTVTTLLLVLACPRFFYACGGDGGEIEFSFGSRPHDFKSYSAGRLGILQPSFWHMYLFAAYRSLTAAPLTAAEQQELEQLWSNIETDLSVSPRDWQNPAVRQWLDRRNRFATVKLDDIRQESSLLDYQWFLNCPDDAFRTARRTLQQRVQRFGASSVEVRQWLEGQDAVFSNCSNPLNSGRMPAPATAQMDPVIRRDRAYQVAAARFYHFDYAEAAADFSSIAQDKESPWHDIAPLLAARCLIRKATLWDRKGDNSTPFDRAALVSARERLRAIASDRHSKYRADARRLLGYVDYRLRPDERSAELAAALRSPQRDPHDMAQELWDYILLLEHDHIAPDDEMGQWIMAWDRLRSEKRVGLPALKDIRERYERSPSPLWLVLLISAARPHDQGLESLLRDAEAAPASSPAHVTLRYHLARIALERGDTARVRELVDPLLASRDLDRSARNELDILRMAAATSFQDFLAHAEHEPVFPASRSLVDHCDAGEPCPGELDPQAASTFSRLPVDMLLQAAERSELAAGTRTSLALAAWTRAVLLQRDDQAEKAARTLLPLWPALRPHLQQYLDARAAVRHFAAVRAMLWLSVSNPAVEPRDSWYQKLEPRGEWWCAGDRGTMAYYDPRQPFDPDNGIPVDLQNARFTDRVPEFLSTGEASLARSELEALRQMPAGPTYLGREALAFARAHPNDPRVPEVLHRIVRASRFGCGDAETGQVSKAAFALLHRKYPNSPWTKQTKYWFSGRNY